MTQERHHHAQTQLNLDIVHHVAKYSPCGFIELYDLFGDQAEKDGKNSMERFRAKLGHLVFTHQLAAHGAAGAKRWTRPSAAPTEGQPARCTTPWVGTVVPPRQHSVMHGPLYVQGAGPALRTGSQDYKAFASRGDQC